MNGKRIVKIMLQFNPAVVVQKLVSWVNDGNMKYDKTKKDIRESIECCQRFSGKFYYRKTDPKTQSYVELRNSVFVIKKELSELNFSRLEIIFQLETRQLRKMVGNHFTTQELLRII